MKSDHDKIVEALCAPVFERHGVGKGTRILAAIGPILSFIGEQCQQWPEDIADDCYAEIPKSLQSMYEFTCNEIGKPKQP